MSKNYMNDSQASEIVKYISDTMKIPLIGAGGGFAPIGKLGFYDGTVAPQGWLACDGTVYNISDYPELAAHYASHHGASNFYGGNGTTTFAVPDLRGEFLRGSGTNSHANQGDGANVGVHQDGTEIGNVYAQANSNYAIFTEKGWVATNRDKTVSHSAKAQVFSNLTTAGGVYGESYTSRPTNTSFLICVKATLSDAEINAFNVYTPREHQVAWWEEEIDGVWKRKPVYERTISGTSPSASGDYPTGITNVDFAGLVSCYIDSGYTLNIAYQNNYVDIKSDGSTIYFSYASGSVYMSKPFRATIQYTKTTDQWQTS